MTSLGKAQENTSTLYKPNKKQALLHVLGAKARERLFCAGNRCGKTFAASQEMSYHLTGLYPKWWKGIKYKKPIQAWAASNSSQSTRDILQVAYLGGVSRQDFGTGSIPKQCIDRTVMSRGIGDAVETVHVKHKSGGINTTSI